MYTYAELVRDHDAEWIFVASGGVIRATHRAAWPPVSLEDASPEALYHKIAEWQADRDRRRRRGGDI